MSRPHALKRVVTAVVLVVYLLCGVHIHQHQSPRCQSETANSLKQQDLP